MNNYRLKLKKLGKKTLIQLIKRLRKEAARLHGALDRITERQDELQKKYEKLREDFAAVTDDMSDAEISGRIYELEQEKAYQIQESKDFSLEEEEEIGWVITYTESGRTEQDTAELVASSSQEAKDKFLETMEYTNRTCHEASPKMFPNRDFTYKILSVEPKEVEVEAEEDKPLTGLYLLDHLKRLEREDPSILNKPVIIWVNHDEHHIRHSMGDEPLRFWLSVSERTAAALRTLKVEEA